MSVKVTFECDGCSATAPGLKPLKVRFLSEHGKGYVWGKIVPDNTPSDVAPEGWMAFDPYTHLTYCPTCWEEIEECPPTTTTPTDAAPPGSGS